MNRKNRIFEYIKSCAYFTPELQSRIMGPNPVKLTEELMKFNRTPVGATVLDLGCGMGVTSIFLAEQYGFKVYAADLWNEPEENQRFFLSRGLSESQIKAFKADALNLPFEKELFDAVVCTDSYNYFGRETGYLDQKLLPYVKSGGYIYLSIAGMKNDVHDDIPPALSVSWTAEQLDFIHDIKFWTDIISNSKDAEIIAAEEMVSNRVVWDDWIKQDNDYARGDAKAINAGACDYLNFLAFVLKKK